MSDLVYPKLSYEVVGALFDVFNELGDGYREKYYENAVSLELERRGIRFMRQVYAPVFYKEEQIGSYYFDFLINDLVVLELKKGSSFSKKHIDQVYEYLCSNNLKLGIIGLFTQTGVRHKRIINIQDSYIRKD